MTRNTGKAKVGPYFKKDNIILVDIYANGELGKHDVDEIHQAIESFGVEETVDTICLKSGKNFLSDEAFEYSLNHHCIHHNRVIYVIKHMADIYFPSEAQNTYFKDHRVDYCTSVNDAYHLLKQMQHWNTGINSGSGTGRIYTITYMVTDAFGNSNTATATVTVPLGKGK